MLYDKAAAHWDALRGNSGRHGPRALMMHTQHKAGIVHEPWQVWRAGGREIQITADANASC